MSKDFDYHLPSELIAQFPLENRSESKMMVVNRNNGEISHHNFSEFKNIISKKDLVVLNDTKVIPARFFSNNNKQEILYIETTSINEWKCLVKPGKYFKIGNTIEIGDSKGIVLKILKKTGERIIKFDKEPNHKTHGQMPLPPYIRREKHSNKEDETSYQTVFAKKEGAIAAPTAGLHFTKNVLKEINHAFLTLHVGIGTFKPVSTDIISDHKMHKENFILPQKTIDLINSHSNTIAIGTTVVRVLESCIKKSKHNDFCKKEFIAGSGATDIFIYPPYKFRAVDSMLTNFHLPNSTLLMLVSAFAQKELIKEAYYKAIEKKYRFFSYGDCMYII